LWLDTSFSEHVLERNMTEHAVQALGAVDSLWGRSEPKALARALRKLVERSRGLLAIDVFRLDGVVAEPAVSTRAWAAAAAATPAPGMAQRLRDGDQVRTRLPDVEGEPVWRLTIPLRREGHVVALAQADVSFAEVARLERPLRASHGVLLVVSILLISSALGVFLERRVNRPVARLVAGMRRAEAGELGVRVALRGGGELAFLGGSLDRMLSRIEELTAGLESRVRQATRELAERNRELEEANEKLWRAQLEIGRSERLAALGQLAATIAHELGTPLNSVLGYTQLLRREELTPAQAEKLAIVESQVQRMIETIRSVLDRTRDREVRRAPVAVEPLVAEVLALVSTRLAGREIVVRREIPADLPPVPADAVGLRQVLLNLLTNAIDATERPGTITVSATRLVLNGRGAPWLEIAVRDSGCGMTPDQARRVFEPFYTTKAPGRGTGLGLAIVDHVVRAHGGEIVVDSAPGEGTTMRVRLPLDD
jgi:signal transduction histidine kinase